MIISHNFKYGSIYRSPSGKLFKYKGSTCSSSKYGNSFNLVFEFIGPGHSPYKFRSYPMFESSECCKWKLSKGATLLY